MSIEPIRARVKGGIWQAVAQSGVDLDKLSAEEQARLVDSISDHMLLVINDVLDDVRQQAGAPLASNRAANAAAEPAPEPDLSGDEKTLWEGRPFLSLVEFYTITDERIKIVRGFLGRDVENFELIRIQDIDFKQNMSERMFGIGDVNITGHDPSNPKLSLRNVKDPQAVYELLRRAWLNSRKKHGLRFQEEM